MSSWTKDRFKRIKEWEENCEFEDYIDEDYINQTLSKTSNPSDDDIAAILDKARQNALKGVMLSAQDTATLLNATSQRAIEEIFRAANDVKREVYGDRIVIFSPLYVSSPCVNDCAYCGFRATNGSHVQKMLSNAELEAEVNALINEGQKRLITVFGEHQKSDYKYIADTVSKIYATKSARGEIRRINVNAAPMFEEEYAHVHKAGIGTFQVFQETYHKKTYESVHPSKDLKGAYKWRLFALHRAIKAGLDDVGAGILLGLYDYRFEVLGMLAQANSLEKYFGIGPHTMSFPRLKAASGNDFASSSVYAVSDLELMKATAIIRLMCPFTGTILTAREEPMLRDEMVNKCGVTQTDAGTVLEIGGYSAKDKDDSLNNQQFAVGDARSIDGFILKLIQEGKLPSFCTSCYREGRTGCEFMPLAKNANIKNLCIPNGLLSFKEYMRDYASDEVKKIGEDVIIPKYLGILQNDMPKVASKIQKMMDKIDNGEKVENYIKETNEKLEIPEHNKKINNEINEKLKEIEVLKKQLKKE